MATYQGTLILFGGYTHPTPYPLHQAARFFNQLHIYNPGTNRWSTINTVGKLGICHRVQVQATPARTGSKGLIICIFYKQIFGISNIENREKLF